MKIGILTFHRAINYGALLQCYALYVVLKSMGHKVEVIDYRPDSIEYDRKYFTIKDFKSKRLNEKFVYLVSRVLQINSRKRMKIKFDDFINTNIKLSKTIMTKDCLSKGYDAIIFGSDQIWNPEICYGFDDVYMGQFNGGKAKKIAYAASVGRMELITDDVSQKFKKYIEVYDFLSVREQTLQIMLADRFNIKCDVVCDPSLLPSREMYYKMTHPVSDNNYIALILEKNPSAEIFAKRISKQIGAKVLRLCAQNNPLSRSIFEVRKELSPSDFLSYIRYARCVITDSFHSTSFSVIMHTNFYTLRRKMNNDRSETILNVAGLSDRIVNSTDEVIYSDVDFMGIDQRLDKYKSFSMEYIKRALE